MIHFDIPSPKMQPEFPLCDLAPENVDYVAVRLGNREAAHDYHTMADAAVAVYGRAHPGIEYYAKRSELESSPTSAVSHGMMLLEAATAAVAVVHEIDMVDGMTAQIVMAQMEKQQPHIIDGAAPILDEFRTILPNTTEVVVEDARRRLGSGLAEYALLGAALERHVIIKSIDRLLQNSLPDTQP